MCWKLTISNQSWRTFGFADLAMVATPSGGRPAAIASSSANAARCGPIRSSAAVQEARNSRSSVLLGPAMSPNRVDDVDVTVPPRAVNIAPEDSRQSVSQLQATSGSSGSRAISSSTSAVKKITIRSVPSHAATPSGSWRSISRPEAESGRSASHTTEADSAWLQGASLVGAGNAPSSISGRSRTAASCSRAASNAAGAADPGDVVMCGTVRPRAGSPKRPTPSAGKTRPRRLAADPSGRPGHPRERQGGTVPAQSSVGCRRSATELMHQRSSVGVL